MCRVSRRAGSEGSTISPAQHRTALSSLHFAWLHQSSFFINLVDFTVIPLIWHTITIEVMIYSGIEQLTWSRKAKQANESPWSHEAGVCCLQQQKGAGTELGSIRIFSKEISGSLYRGLLLRYKILLSCKTQEMHLGAESPFSPHTPAEWSHCMDSILK